MANDLDGIVLSFPDWQDPLEIGFDPPRPVEAEDMQEHQEALLPADADRLAGELSEARQQLEESRPQRGGALPKAMQRRAFLAKFNPGDNVRFGGRFIENDIESEFPWRDPIGAAAGDGAWLSADLRGATIDLAAVQPGDLVFTQRSTPEAPNGYRPEHGRQARKRLVGVTFVRSLHRRWDAQKRRDATEPILVPLASFDRAVDVATILNRRKNTTLYGATAFRDRRRRTLVPLDPNEADLLADACQLPRAALSVERIEPLAAKIGHRCPGMRDPDAAYLNDAIARNTVRRAHEHRGAQAVARAMQARGWSVGNYPETTKGAGADLDLWHPDLGPDPTDWRNRVLVEVKGYGSSRLRSVHLQQAQYDLACRMANTGHDNMWRLVVVLSVESKVPVVQVWTPKRVRDEWPLDQVR